MARIVELDLLPALLLNFFFGAFWYGPLFGELYQKSLKISSAELEKRKLKGQFFEILAEILGNILFVTFYKFLIVHFKLMTLQEILGIGQAIWLGFIFPSQLSPVVWENKPKKLLFIYTAHRLISVLLVGTIFYLI